MKKIVFVIALLLSAPALGMQRATAAACTAARPAAASAAPSAKAVALQAALLQARGISGQRDNKHTKNKRTDLLRQALLQRMYDIRLKSNCGAAFLGALSGEMAYLSFDAALLGSYPTSSSFLAMAGVYAWGSRKLLTLKHNDVERLTSRLDELD